MDALEEGLRFLEGKRDQLNAAIATIRQYLGAPLGVAEGWAPTPPSALKNPEPWTQPKEPKRSGPHRTPNGVPNDRERAIVRIMRANGNVSTGKELRDRMPREEGMDDEEHSSMVRNTLTKMRVKGLVGRTGDTWSLTNGGE